MATIKAFRALRYDGAAGPLKDLVCPLEEPGTEELRQLYGKSEQNIAHIVFPREGRDPLEQARYQVVQWRAGGILRRDESPGLYVCEQSFLRDGASCRMLQLFALVRLDGEADAYRESPPRSFDPFHLLCATHINFDAMQALVPDPDEALFVRLREAACGTPLFSFDDESGISYKVWRLDDPAEHDRLAALLQGVRLTLTSGKRRYDAALRYLDHLRHKGPGPAGEAEWALMALCPAAQDNVDFLPAQLLLSLPGFDEGEFLEECGAYCAIERIAVGDLGRAAQEARELGETAVGLLTQEGAYLLALRDAAAMDELFPGSRGARGLPYHMLDSLLLGRVLGVEDKTVLRYLHSPARAIAAVEEGSASLAFFLSPITPLEAFELAEAGEPTAPEAAALYPPMIAGHLMAELE